MCKTRRKIHVLDGSFSTELSNVLSGYFEKQRPNWTFDAVISNPEAVIEVHKRFIDAGSDYLTTNTYHASLPSLREQGLDGAALIKTLFICSKRPLPAIILIRIDEFGVLLTMTDYHKEQINAMVCAGIYSILFETVSSVMEGQAISDALSMSTDDKIKAVVSFTCRKDGIAVRHGEKFSDAVKLVLNNSKVIGFGINCTHPGAVTALLESVQPISPDLEVFVYPNSGKYENNESEENPTKIVLSSIRTWVELGATAIGGCCGFDAGIISEIRSHVDHLNSVKNDRS